MIPIAYRMPDDRPRRLARITALGVLAVIFGSLGVIGNLLAIPFFVSWLSAAMKASSPPPPVPAASWNVQGWPTIPVATTLPSSVPLVGGEILGERGLPAEQRKIAMDVLTRGMVLSSHQQQALDLLLCEKGKDIFAVDGALTRESALACMLPTPATNPDTEHPGTSRGRRGRRQRHRPAQPGRSSGAQALEMVISLRTGSLTLGDDRAIFDANAPSAAEHGAPVPISGRFSYEIDFHPGGSIYRSPGRGPHLCTGAIAQAIDDIRGKFGADAVNAKQATAMVLFLRGYMPPNGDTPALPRLQGRSPAGTLMLSLASAVSPNNTLWVDRAGRAVYNPPIYLDPNTFAAKPPPPAFVPGTMPSSAGSPLAPAEFIGEAAASALLGVLLVITGIAALRHAPISRRLGIIYGWIGVLLAIAEAGLGLYWSSDFYDRLGLPSPGIAVIAVTAVIGFLLAAALPVAFLIVMRSQRVRAYLVAPKAH